MPDRRSPPARLPFVPRQTAVRPRQTAVRPPPDCRSPRKIAVHPNGNEKLTVRPSQVRWIISSEGERRLLSFHTKICDVHS